MIKSLTIKAVPNAKGTVVICHGFGEHKGLYTDMLDRFNAAGYVACVYDQPGHGVWTIRNGMPISKWQGIIPRQPQYMHDYLEVITSSVRYHHPDLPLCLYGHSMGGNIAMNYLLRQPENPYTCAILESPWLDLHTNAKPGAFTLKLVRSLGKLKRNIAKINPLDFTKICNDPAMQIHMAQDEVYHNRMSMRLLADILDGCEYALTHAADIRTPVYMAYAQHEAIVCNDAIEAFVQACPKVEAKAYDACHAVHNCLARDELYADMAAFLDRCCAAALNTK